MQKDFVERHSRELTPGLQAKWLRRLFREATQIVNQFSASQLVLSLSDSEQMRLLLHLGCTNGVQTCLLPEIPCARASGTSWQQTRSFGTVSATGVTPSRPSSAFLRLQLLSQLWWQVLELVSPFFDERLTWLDIALVKKTHGRDNWEARKDAVGDVLHTLRTVTLHFSWSDRNRCLFDE
ncbi:hypothetical protein Plhal304r1_c037g0112951 [Plasmopara halstedii]